MRIPHMTAALILVCSFATTAHAGPIVSYTGTTDTNFLAYLGTRGVTLPANELAVAQARSGNNATNGDYELGLHIPPNFTNAGPVGTPGQIAWGTAGGNNSYVAFNLSRTGTELKFSMGNYTGSYIDPLVAEIDALGLRLRSDGTGNSTSLRNLKLGSTSLGDFTASGGGLSFAVFEGFSGNFNLTGEAALNWASGNIPSGSRLGFQIKALDVPNTVPEPTTLALVGAALAGAALSRRRRPC